MDGGWLRARQLTSSCVWRLPGDPDGSRHLVDGAWMMSECNVQFRVDLHPDQTAMHYLLIDLQWNRMFSPARKPQKIRGESVQPGG